MLGFRCFLALWNDQVGRGHRGLAGEPGLMVDTGCQQRSYGEGGRGRKCPETQGDAGLAGELLGM